jgi:SH3 domain protein
LRLSLPLLLFSLFLSAAGLAADTRYVGGEQPVNLRGGAGGDYPIVYRGIAPGTPLTVARTSEDGLWADVTAQNGITGWIPTQILVLEMPAQPAKPAATAATTLAAPLTTGLAGQGTAGAEAASGDPAQATESADLLSQVHSCDAEFNAVAQELHQLKQVSGKAVQLDIDNHRLVEESENLRSEVEMLQAENQRLLDKIHSEDFMNGALAVLLGVIIALVAPRLVPKRRKSSSWT